MTTVTYFALSTRPVEGRGSTGRHAGAARPDGGGSSTAGGRHDVSGSIGDKKCGGCIGMEQQYSTSLQRNAYETDNALYGGGARFDTARYTAQPIYETLNQSLSFTSFMV